MTERVFFSIVLATYGRGRHIKPTIESVLLQSHRAFELIVVGDGCDDETEAAVRSFADHRVTWRNLAQNSGSQSDPNNEGIRGSRGEWIAYIGHDDIWTHDHLESIARTVASAPDADFVVAGCIYHGPAGSEVYSVTGLFSAPETPFHHFFPPTSLAHRRSVTQQIGPWRDPREIRPPVDAEFLLRAARAGLRFAPTGKITAHKFAAGHRYLSYLRVTSGEQRALLDELRAGGGPDIETLIAISKANGDYMTMVYPQSWDDPAGSLFERNRQNKGISRAPLRPLHERAVTEQTGEGRALDWYGLETSGRPFRWSGPNPRPKVLIPFTGTRARISLELLAIAPGAKFEDLSLYVEDTKVKSVIEANSAGNICLVAEIGLKPSGYTVLTLETPTFRPREVSGSADPRKLGVAVAAIALDPIEPARVTVAPPDR